MPSRSSAAESGLRALPAAAIVAAVADAAERWTDADFPSRVRATAEIEARLGYTTPVVDVALDRLFGGLTRAALQAAIAGELGSLEALDGPAEQPGRPPGWARGVERVAIVASDTTIGVAIWPLAFALCAKCSVTVKDRSDGLTAAFVATLGEERPEAAAAVDVRTWTGGADDTEAALLGAADVVVAFGGDDALRAIRSHAAPEATFVPYGRRASAGYVSAAALAGDLPALAQRIARDALLYDGDGCLSLHLCFAEGDAAACAPFARALADACERASVEFPPGRRAPARAAAVAQYAGAASFRAAVGRGRVWQAGDAAWAVILDPPRTDLPPFGGGTIPVYPVTGPADAAALLNGLRVPLQAVGCAGVEDPAALAVALGAVRAAPLGTLQDPPLAGRHGGRPRIADFVRWIDLT